MRKFIFLLSFLITISIIGQQSYYDNVDLTLSGIPLKVELASKITNTHSNILSYSEAREALKIVDLVPGQGDLVYLVYGFAPELCPASPGNDNEHRRRDKSNFDNGTNDPCLWNREHTYPKSLGTPDLGTSGPGADAHMLRACDKKRNAERGNKLFKEGSGNSHTIDANSWYAGDEWKGDMARIIMYMYLRYGDQCKPINVGYGNSIAIDTYMIDLFLQWNAEDPVSEYEENRNNYMENTSNTYGQGNRNPFIDNPYLATRIWGGQEAEDIWGIYLGADDLNLESTVLVYPNPSSDIVFIKASDNFEINNILIYSITGDRIKFTNNTKSNGISLKEIPSGFYFLHINTSQGLLIKKLVVTKD